MVLRRSGRGPAIIWFVGFLIAVMLWIAFLGALLGTSFGGADLPWQGILVAVLAMFVTGLLWGNRNMVRHGNWPGMDPQMDLGPTFEARLKPATGSDPARWLSESLTTFSDNVASLLPSGFEACARIFHPASKGGEVRRVVGWKEVADSNRRTFHPGAQWPNIAFTDEIRDINRLQDPPPGAPWDRSPEEGSLDRNVARIIGYVLRQHTSTPDRCWFAFWEGWGALRADIADAPRLLLPSRSYRLMIGSVEDVTETASPWEEDYQSASLWWPDDRAWCVATEVDFDTTYIAGSRSCIEAVLSHPELEVLEISPDHGIGWFSDTVNPSPMRRD